MSLDKPCDMSALCGSGSECRNRATPVNESSRLLTDALGAEDMRASRAGGPVAKQAR
jgi:hypothetical protein